MIRPANHDLAMKGSVSILTWLTAAVVVLTALALAAAHAPSRIKLIGLFSVGYGLAAGVGLAMVARQTLQPPHRAAVWLAFPLIVGGELGLTWQSYRLRVDAIERRSENATGLLLDRLEQQSDVPADVKSEFARAESDRASFEAFLGDRVAPLGDWAAPGPMAFWLIEVLAGGAAGAWLTSRMLMARDSQTQHA